MTVKRSFCRGWAQCRPKPFWGPKHHRVTCALHLLTQMSHYNVTLWIVLIQWQILNYCPPGHRCGSGGPSPWNVEVGSCDFLYSGAFLGWAAGDSFGFIAFCFLTCWGSDFTPRLGLQGPLTSWAIQVYQRNSIQNSSLLCLHARCVVYAHDSNAGRHSSCRQVYWSWNQNHLVLNYSLIHVTCLMSLICKQLNNTNNNNNDNGPGGQGAPSSCLVHLCLAWLWLRHSIHVGLEQIERLASKPERKNSSCFFFKLALVRARHRSHTPQL